MELNLTCKHCMTREIYIYIYTCKYSQVVVFVVYGIVRNMGYPSATISIHHLALTSAASCAEHRYLL
jgi:hypothetical protein